MGTAASPVTSQLKQAVEACLNLEAPVRFSVESVGDGSGTRFHIQPFCRAVLGC